MHYFLYELYLWLSSKFKQLMTRVKVFFECSNIDVQVVQKWKNETCGSSMFNSGSEADDSEKASAEPTEDKNDTIFSQRSLKRSSVAIYKNCSDSGVVNGTGSNQERDTAQLYYQNTLLLSLKDRL